MTDSELKAARKKLAEQGLSPFSKMGPPVEHRWKPGQSGNPAGRPAMGLRVQEWINLMADMTAKQVRDIAVDENSPNAKAIAARAVLHARSMELTSGGLPIAGSDFDRIMDRTVGKPHQSVELNGHVENTVNQTVAREIMEKPDAFAAALEFERVLHQPGGAGVDADAGRADATAIPPPETRPVPEPEGRDGGGGDWETPPDR